LGEYRVSIRWDAPDTWTFIEGARRTARTPAIPFDLATFRTLELYEVQMIVS
jgi:hypothetical protein